MAELSLADWLLGFAKTSVLGVLSALWASYYDLPIALSGFIAFSFAYLLWMAINIHLTIRRIEKRGLENPLLRYLKSDAETLIRGSESAAEKASIKFQPLGTTAILNSENISSITDVGPNFVRINFSKNFRKDEIKASVLGVPPKDFKFISVNRSGAEITFDESTNPTISLKFEI